MSKSPKIPLLTPPIETLEIQQQENDPLKEQIKSKENNLNSSQSPIDDDLGAAALIGEEQEEEERVNQGDETQNHSNDNEDDIIAISSNDVNLQQGDYQQIGQSNLAPTKKKLDRSQLMRKILINVLLIALWFFFSTLMNLYNSWLFSKKRQNFVYPLFTTSIHMIVQFGLSSFFMSICKNNTKIVPRQRNGKRARPTSKMYLSNVLPCALAAALDIGLSNLSLKSITLTFYTMCKSSNLAFVLLFAFLFGLEKLRWSLIAIILLITIGVIMMVAAETEFVLEGAIEVLTASAMGGLRWALMQILLKRKKMGMSNPIATMFWLSPLMGIFMIVASLILESWKEMWNSSFFSTSASTFRTIILLVTPGLIVFLMNLSEFSLIQRTSVMTLSVAGIFKEILTIMISSTVFGDELTPINVTGLCIAILGIALYNYFKYRLLMKNYGAGKRTRGRHGVDDDEEDEDEEDDVGDLSVDVESTRNSRATTSGNDATRYSELNGRSIESPIKKIQSLPNKLSTSEALITSESDVLLPTTNLVSNREEEADLVGWHSSGFQRTSNGWDLDDEDDDDDDDDDGTGQNDRSNGKEDKKKILRSK